MSLLNKISINTIIPDLTKYYYFLQGVEKIGKTTFFRDLVLQLFNGDPTQGLLLAIGSEKGFKALDNIQVIEIETWADFVGIINGLCQSKQHGIKLVGVDTYDELVELAFDDQCTGANPAYPLMTDIKQIYIDAFNGVV